MKPIVVLSLFALALVADVTRASEAEKTEETAETPTPPTAKASTTTTVVIVLASVAAAVAICIIWCISQDTKCVTRCLALFVFIWEKLEVVGNCICANCQFCRRSFSRWLILFSHRSKLKKDTFTRRTNMKNRRPVGLRNQGSTCYFNAVMQVVNQTSLLESQLEGNDTQVESKDIQEYSDGGNKVRQLVGESLFEVIHGIGRDVIVLFYGRDDLDRCQPVERMFGRLADTFQQVIFAKFDVTANRMMRIESDVYPTVKLYRRIGTHEVYVYQFPWLDEIALDDLGEFLDVNGEITWRFKFRIVWSHIKHVSIKFKRRFACSCHCFLQSLCYILQICSNSFQNIFLRMIASVRHWRFGTTSGYSRLSSRDEAEDERRICVDTCGLLKPTDRETLTDALREFIDEMATKCERKQYRESYTPRRLFAKLCQRSPRFQDGQQDSHELLRHLMDGIKEEEIRRSQHDLNIPYRRLTIVDEIFGGHYVTVFHCRQCKTPYHLFEPFLDMSLPIAFNDSDIRGSVSQEICDHEQAKDVACYTDAVGRLLRPLARKPVTLPDSVLSSLRFYTRQEQLDEYLCLTCNQGLSDYFLTRGWKQTIVYNPPAILTIHLKRFEQTPNGYVKVSRPVKFQTTLDLAPFCSSLSKRRREDPSIRYTLYGVVVHSGNSLKSGHYTACVKVRTVDVSKTAAFLQKEFLDREALMERSRLIELVEETRQKPCYLVAPSIDKSSGTTSDTWYDISDTRVFETTEKQVLDMEAYLLFYERIH